VGRLELAEKVNGIDSRLGKVEQKVEDLSGWQKSQNGAIHEVNKKVERLQFWIMGLLASSLVSLLLLLAK
jgi:peptidoglycan hydrolase CwlO-like protein